MGSVYASSVFYIDLTDTIKLLRNTRVPSLFWKLCQQANGSFLLVFLLSGEGVVKKTAKDRGYVDGGGEGVHCLGQRYINRNHNAHVPVLQAGLLPIYFGPLRHMQAGSLFSISVLSGQEVQNCNCTTSRGRGVGDGGWDCWLIFNNTNTRQNQMYSSFWYGYIQTFKKLVTYLRVDILSSRKLHGWGGEDVF